MRVKPSKKNFERSWKKKKNLILGKKFGKKNFEKKGLEKRFDKKKFGKINSKTKIFITKLYSNIDKCHNIFALLAPFDETGRKTRSNVNVCGIWFKIGSVARSHWTQGMRWFERSREKRYITACELYGIYGNSLPYERYLLHRWYDIFDPGLPLR